MRQKLTKEEQTNRMLRRVFSRAIRKPKGGSRYTPHQGKKECDRRLRRMGAL